MIAENVKNIRQRIASACNRVGRSTGEVTLIAVSKTFNEENIREAVDAGVGDIGENYVREFIEKRNALQDREIRWHFIGHLQRNKVKEIIPWIHLIHSVDSKRLAEEISLRASKAGRTISILVEVNTSNEQTKFGVMPEQTTALVKELINIPNVNVAGLMTIGPFLPDAEDSRPGSRTLRHIKERIEDDGIQLQHLSMGMTNDVEVAVEEGATLVRIGTAIFGKRTKITND